MPTTSIRFVRCDHFAGLARLAHPHLMIFVGRPPQSRRAAHRAATIAATAAMVASRDPLGIFQPPNVPLAMAANLAAIYLLSRGIKLGQVVAGGSDRVHCLSLCFLAVSRSFPVYETHLRLATDERISTGNHHCCGACGVDHSPRRRARGRAHHRGVSLRCAGLGIALGLLTRNN